MADTAYTKTVWADGDIITDVKLNNAETGIEAANNGVAALKAAKATATALDAGADPTVTFDGTTFAFGIPKGDKGDKGDPGDNGQDGAAGAKGADGLSFRVTTETLVASGTGALAKITGAKAVVGDVVLGADGNLWAVATVTDTNYTVGKTALVKLALATA